MIVILMTWKAAHSRSRISGLILLGGHLSRCPAKFGAFGPGRKTQSPGTLGNRKCWKKAFCKSEFRLRQLGPSTTWCGPQTSGCLARHRYHSHHITTKPLARKECFHLNKGMVFPNFESSVSCALLETSDEGLQILCWFRVDGLFCEHPNRAGAFGLQQVLSQTSTVTYNAR